jgi:uncharacterized protein (DUF1501 family)
MNRRSFIEQSTLGLGMVSQIKLDKLSLAAYSPQITAEENENILVVVQLFGGNDGINTITPYEWDRYYNELRPKLHIPQSLVTPISKDLGLAMHPSLTKGVNNGILGLHRNGKLSIIQGVGYEFPNFSHFRSTDIWFSGISPQNDGQLLRTGWLGRYFDKYDGAELPENPYCIHVGRNPSLIFQGEKTEKAILVENPDDLFEQAKEVISEKIDAGEKSFFSDEFDYINAVGIKVNQFSKVIKTAFDKGKNSEAYPDKGISNQLKLVARLIDGGLKTKVYFVELDGFDTHSAQGTTEGLHARLLGEMSEAIASFQSDIEKLGHSKRVIGITLSEFGRRPYENGSLGTDHGTSNVMFAFGEQVKGEIFGSNIAFLPFRDEENLSYRYDYRSIYWEILRSWFGTSDSYAEKVLSGRFALVDQKGFIKTTVEDKTLPPPVSVPVVNNDPKSPQNPNSPYNATEQDTFTLFQNPVVNGQAKILTQMFVTNKLSVEQYDIKGTFYGEIMAPKEYRPGTYFLNADMRGDHGLYILHIKVGRRNHYLKAIKL